MLIANLIQNPLLLITFIISILLAITVHEFAHAYTALKAGDPTAKVMGRVTLNPIAHLDPMGTIFLFLVGFGWGKPVPTNPSNFRKKSDEILIALSGIIANLIFAAVLAIPLRIASLKGITLDSNLWLNMLSIAVDINIVLAAFNILPISPLDGSHVVEYFMSEESKINFRTYGPFILLGILIIDRASNLSILSGIMEPIIRIFSIIVKGTFSFFI
ncbi:MAG: Peptidase family M50 [bacterium ADurb.Bin212]|nr:MAG: Peptidase family M50 [bacterium ADurb.Bin212]